MAKPTGWSDWNDDERAEWLFHSPERSIESDLQDLPEADAIRLRGLIEQKWNGLSDDERVDLLIKGGQWMREGVRARVRNPRQDGPDHQPNAATVAIEARRCGRSRRHGRASTGSPRFATCCATVTATGLRFLLPTPSSET